MGRIREERVLTLERQTANLQVRLSALEQQLTGARVAAGRAPGQSGQTATTAPASALAPAAGRPAAAPAAGAWPAPTTAPIAVAASSPPACAAAEAPAAAPAARRERPDLEELLGGRVLAWTGGVAVLAGIAFLLAIAVSRGWIGPAGRTLVAGVLSLGMIGAGAWRYEHRGRTDAALAALAAGIAGLFVTVAVGGPVYGVLPAMIALLLALASGALATTFAVRWQTRGIGALGIVGALLAPVLAGAPSTATTLLLLWLAGASGAAVLVWQRWSWLALAVYAIPLAQWAWWIGDAQPSVPVVVLVLTLFGAVNAAAAIGFELRVPATRLRAASALLLTANATTLALAGWYALDEAGATTTGRLWIGALAAAHIGVGLATRATRLNRDVRMLALLLGVVLADVTAGLLLEGPVLAAAFAITTAGFAWRARRVLTAQHTPTGQRNELLLGLGLGGHLLLTTMQALTQAPPDALSSGDSIAFAGYAAIAAAACAAFVAGRLVDEVRHEWRTGLDIVALTGAAYLTAATLDGPPLAAAFAAEAFALGAIAQRGRDTVAAWAGAAYLTLALGHALVFEATPDALLDGVDDLAGAGLALAAAAAAALLGMHLLASAGASPVVTQGRATLATTGVIALLYLGSVAIVTTFGPGDGAQLLLSGLWAISGVAALVAGLRRDDRALRIGSLTLLLVSVGKVFLYDLSALTSLYRVGSFIGLGLLLLVAAGIWQRMRPPALPDLRDVPPAVR